MSAESPISFGQAALFWLKLGWIGFGGPAGQIALMHRELVERRHWISERRFLHALNYCMLLPGPEAQQLATYLGWLMHRTLGGLVAGVLFVLPSLFILIGLAWIYLAFGQLPLVEGLFYGIKSAVIAIVAQAVWRIGGRTLRNPALWSIAVLAFLAIFVAGVPFPAIVAGAALLGVLGGRWFPASFVLAGPTAAEKYYGPALIDDETPRPTHARFRWSRLALVLACCGALWLIPMLGLMAVFGWSHTLTQMGWFFTKAALLTFGGAYAVLPYVWQGAVEHYGWLLPVQMIDGLALGETTPGPLIMVVAFVAFVGGYGQALFGPGALFLAGVAAAVVVTWVTFLPSFLFIFAGAPLIESTRNEARLHAPLTAITAAVVGVILNLALFFAWHVFWPRGFAGSFDGWSAILALLAGVALIRGKASVLLVIFGCGLAGLCLRWIM